MSMKHSVTHTACRRSLLIVLLLVLARESTAYSSGGTYSSCSNGIPGGGFSNHGTQQSGRGGYAVQYSPALATGKTFSTGVTYQITLSGGTYNGFLIVASGGSITSSQSRVAAQTPCGEASATHTSSSGKTSVTFNWTPPSGTGNANIRFTVYESPQPNGRYWIFTEDLVHSTAVDCSSAPADTTCTASNRPTCSEGSVANTCGPCNDGFFDTSNPAGTPSNMNTCQACNEACSVCVDSSTVCAKCATGFQDDGGNCVEVVAKNFTTGSKLVLPSGCVGTDCTQGVEWAIFNTTQMHFKLFANNADWVGIGLSKDGRMTAMDVYTAYVPTTGSPQVTNRRSTGYSQPGLDDAAEPQGGLTNIVARRVNNRIEVEFTRPIVAHFSNDADLRETWRIALVWGSGNLNQHANRGEANGPVLSASSVDLRVQQSAVSAVRTTKATKGAIIHGTLMVLAWVCFSPSGSYTARYFKQLGPIWLQLHLAMQVIATLLTVTGIVVITLEVDGFSSGTHQTLGIVVVALCTVQVLLGMFRNQISGLSTTSKTGDEDDGHGPRRWLFNFMHWTLGRLVLPVLAVITVALGMNLIGIESKGFTYLYAWIAVSIVVILILELIRIKQQGNINAAVEQHGTALLIALAIASATAIIVILAGTPEEEII